MAPDGCVEWFVRHSTRIETWCHRIVVRTWSHADHRQFEAQQEAFGETITEMRGGLALIYGITVSIPT